MGLNVMCTGGTGQKVLVDNTLGSASEYDIMSSFDEELFNSEIDVAMLNDKAYIFGNSSIYAFDGHGFTILNTALPRRNHRSCLTVYDGKIMSVSGSGIKVFDGETVTNFAYQFSNSSKLRGIASLNNDLFLFVEMTNGSTGVNYISIFKLNNGQWLEILEDISSSVFEPDESTLVTFNGKIYILGSKYVSGQTSWAKSMKTFDGTSIASVQNDSYVARGRVSVFDDKMHIMYPYSYYSSEGGELIIDADNSRSFVSYKVNHFESLAISMMSKYSTRVKVNGEEYFLLLYGGIVAKKTADNNIDIVSLIAS